MWVKPKVYIETSVISYFTSCTSQDLIVAAHQALTAQWWNEALGRYRPVISQYVLDEVEAGDARAAQARLDAVADFALIETPGEAIERVALALLARHALPCPGTL